MFHRLIPSDLFMTGVYLVLAPGGRVRWAAAGHHPPLWVDRRGRVSALDLAPVGPVLGFEPIEYRTVGWELGVGDRLLLFTDGLGEARREGEFFPIGDRAWRLLGHGTVGDGLASLETALVEWVHGRLDDDIAVVLLEYTGQRPVTTATVPSWEVGAADG
jgi:phosphoserine phosphatase RsbU/P